MRTLARLMLHCALVACLQPCLPALGPGIARHASAAYHGKRVRKAARPAWRR